MRGNEVIESGCIKHWNIAVCDKNRSLETVATPQKFIQSTLNCTPSSRDIVLIRDDDVGVIAKDFIGNKVTLVAYDCDQMIGIRTGSSAECVPDHR